MNAEIITIGDELLIGQVINTNQAFIAEQLNTAGIAVSRMVTVGDTEVEILRSFDEAWMLGRVTSDGTRRACNFLQRSA